MSVKAKSGRDLPKSPKFLPYKRGRFPAAFYESDGGALNPLSR